MKLQSAVKKETVAVAAGTGIGCVVLIALFLIMYLIFPESSVKFDYRVVLGALCGGAVAVANFFLMAVTVQNVVNVTNRDDALRMMRVSYRNRMLMRGLWVIVAIVAPCFNYAAGIIPLFIPSLVIKIRGIRMGVTGKSAAKPADEGETGSSEAAEPAGENTTAPSETAEPAGKNTAAPSEAAEPAGENATGPSEAAEPAGSEGSGGSEKSE
ncbi:MAG: ATP synthase subunit I [Lachnospiraceae bacterium]|nr:ATP synthase subunit I [Lachnospiraceae bacterium]